LPNPDKIGAYLNFLGHLEMNASNTKLATVEKEILVDMKIEFAEMGGELFYFPAIGLTVAMVPAGEVAKVATAVASPLEKKFRRKVGAYKAIERVMWNHEYTLVPLPYSLEHFAESLAATCANLQA
jgi:hypothetical protein